MGGRSRMSISRPATKTDVWFEERYVNIDFQKDLAEICSRKLLFRTYLAIATAKNVRQIAHSVESLLPL